MSSSQPLSYARSQIILHWLIAALVFFQIIFGENIGDFGRALRDGTTPEMITVVLGRSHVIFGITILMLMIARLALRIKHGAPAPVPAPKVQDFLARAAHNLLYVSLIAAPLTGIAAWFFGIREAGAVHHYMKPAFILLIALHIVGALWHKFVLKDAVMKRMLSSTAE
ncbi:MAG: cytochrome b/b6 domain-containing protein [Roseibium sp.]